MSPLLSFYSTPQRSVSNTGKVMGTFLVSTKPQPSRAYLSFEQMWVRVHARAFSRQFLQTANILVGPVDGLFSCFEMLDWSSGKTDKESFLLKISSGRFFAAHFFANEARSCLSPGSLTERKDFRATVASGTDEYSTKAMPGFPGTSLVSTNPGYCPTVSDTVAGSSGRFWTKRMLCGSKSCSTGTTTLLVSIAAVVLSSSSS
mmetsp:Transcript_8496/g.37879  ORF Transcript_8496/g.37879 Transcript_8496/m.37879 type:complete len:203 (-) Transcript_8496:699-1307(-)